VGFTYDNANRRATLTLPNGVVTSYGYDTASQLTGMTYALGNNPLGNLSYAYDNDGRRSSATGTFARTGLPLAMNTTAYNANNQLTTWGTANLFYDLNGNMTSDGTHSYTWDARNRLTQIDSGSTASFSYDASGRRTSKTVLSTQTGFFYDGANAVQELSGSTPTANLLSGGIDEVFQRTDSAGARSFLTDALGSTLALTDSTGTTQTSYTFEPFGNTTSTGSASTNSFAYTGRELDATGLYYYRARYYNPTLQRFVSEDPLGFGGGDTNLYGYAGGSPANVTDPSGMDYTTYKSVMGPWLYVEASVTIYGPGASPELAAQWQQAITETWNRNPGFGKCKVMFQVQVISDPNATGWQNAISDPNFAGANNFIYVPAGSPADLGNPHIDLTRPFSLSTGTIPSGTLSFTVAHEFGHLLHLFDSNIGGHNINPWRPDNDIMNEGNVVSQYDINRVVGRGCGCK